jgi:hypothetical protein
VSGATRLVFITSLERSGSTLLDVTLGRHPSIVSFGEVARVLQPHDGAGVASVATRLCSCGVTVKDCSFWGPLTEEIARREATLDLTRRYSLFIAHFRSTFGEGFLPVDSSKFLAAMQALLGLRAEGLDLRILFTVRDVRGWISSCRRAERLKRELPLSLLFSRNILRWWKPYLRHNVLRRIPFLMPLEWYVRNRRLERFVSRNQLALERLSYEGLSLHTKTVLASIYSFIGVDERPLERTGASHIVRGNRMAFDTAKTASIQYDSKWLSELWPQYEAMMWPFVMTQNRKWVYES